MEVRDVAGHSAVHWTGGCHPFPAKNYAAQSANSSEAEKPCSDWELRLGTVLKTPWKKTSYLAVKTCGELPGDEEAVWKRRDPKTPWREQEKPSHPIIPAKLSPQLPVSQSSAKPAETLPSGARPSLQNLEENVSVFVCLLCITR